VDEVSPPLEEAHEKSVLVCQDVFLLYEKGILLANKFDFISKKSFSPLGGTMERGVDDKTSLVNLIKRISNLDIKNIQELGIARIFLRSDPFKHEKGTDTLNLVYYAEAEGELSIKDILYIPANKYSEFKKKIPLTPYVSDFLNLACQRAMGL